MVISPLLTHAYDRVTKFGTVTRHRDGYLCGKAVTTEACFGCRNTPNLSNQFFCTDFHHQQGRKGCKLKFVSSSNSVEGVLF